MGAAGLAVVSANNWQRSMRFKQGVEMDSRRGFGQEMVVVDQCRERERKVEGQGA
jgi:hypothetical protein